MTDRRTPALTAQARELFEGLYAARGFRAGVTIPLIAQQLDLTADQVRDAILSPSADVWRQGWYLRRREQSNAVH